jgi:putative ABC transport system permease protein
MNLYTLIKRSLWHYRRTNLALLAGAAIGTGVLSGALMVGDSVQTSLDQRVHERLGKTTFTIATGEMLTQASLAKRLAEQLGVKTAALLSLPGSATRPDGNARANHVRIHGIDDDFFALAPSSTGAALPGPHEIALNQRLATHLGLAVGDPVVLHVDTPGAIHRDLPVGAPKSGATSLRLRVSHILPPELFGRFGLRAEQSLPMNAFVARDVLAKAIDAQYRANLILVGTAPETLSEAGLTTTIQTVWEGADVGLSLQEQPQGDLELRSSRIFMSERVVEAARSTSPRTTPILTYFVNSLSTQDAATPYSFVAGIANSPLLDGMPNAAIAVNRWLADDLNLKPDDMLTLHYSVVNAKNQLAETNRAFRIHRIVSMEEEASEPSLVPDFPGLSDVDNCRDWDSRLPIDLKRIRDKDEAYWDAHGGAPKAFVTLADAQSMWRNQHGIATAVRFSAPAKASSKLLADLLSKLTLGDMGIRIVPIREIGLRASQEGLSFGQLFLGLSFFLIAAAVLLTGLIFTFGIAQRAEETGILLALGIPQKIVQRFRILEGACIALPGALLGVGVGILFNAMILKLLSGSWQAIVGTVPLALHISPVTCVTGFACGAAAAWLAMWTAGHKQFIRPTAELQRAPCSEMGHLRMPSFAGIAAGVVCWTATIIMVISVKAESASSVAGLFFGAGFVALSGCLCFSHAALAWLGKRSTNRPTQLDEMGLRACARHPQHSLTIIGILAAGTFLVIATGGNRPGSLTDIQDPASGSGGFDFFAEAAIPIHEDINTAKGRDRLGLESNLDANFVPIRIFDGDDASCLNLNRITHPPIWGIDPEALDARFTFAGTAEAISPDAGWSALDTPIPDGIPAIADQAVILWGLGLSIGETLTTRDEAGQPLPLHLVAGTANSILQGNMVISESNFMARFPNTSGYRAFLIHVNSGDPSAIAQHLSRALADYGVEITPSAARLATFASIQDTYLSIFMMLGALGLLLGSAGMGIVVARNVMARRGELAMLSAVGFKRSAIFRLLGIEHAALFSVGMLSGVVSGLVAILPAVQSQGSPVSPLALGILIVGLILNGCLWVSGAIAITIRGPLLPALRQE